MWLARCSRNVTLVDGSMAPEHDGFETVTCLRATVDDVEQSRFGFTVHCGDGTTLNTRTLLLAKDLVVPTPAILGAERFYGTSLHQCPYCDGWEHRDQQIGVLGADEGAVDLALKLLQWSPRLTVFSNGGTVDTGCVKRLEKGRIPVVSGIVSELEGQDRRLELLRIDGATHPCDALFFSSPRRYHSALAARLGCDVERMSGAVCWRPDGDLVIAGLFVAGSILGIGEITAAAASEGLKAAKVLNDWLLAADHSPLADTPVRAGTRNFSRTGALRRMAI